MAIQHKQSREWIYNWEVITSAFYIHNSKIAETVLPFLTNQYTTKTKPTQNPRYYKLLEDGLTKLIFNKIIIVKSNYLLNFNCV